MAFRIIPANARGRAINLDEPRVSINKKSIGFNPKAFEILVGALPNGQKEIFGVDLFYDNETRSMGFIPKDKEHATTQTWKLYKFKGEIRYVMSEKVIQEFNLFNLTRSVISKDSFAPRVEGEMVVITIR